MPAWIESMFRRECIRRLSAWTALIPTPPNATPTSSTPGFRKSKSKPGRVSKKTAKFLPATTLLVGDCYLIVKSSKPISETTSGELVLISADMFNHM